MRRSILEITGAELKENRTKLRLTQKDVADKIGVSRNVIVRFETGKGGDVVNLLKLLEFFRTADLNLDVFISDVFFIYDKEKKEEKYISGIMDDFIFIE